MSEANGEDDPAEFHGRIDDAEEALSAADTEADLDDVAATLDAIAEELEAATLPEPPEPADEDEEAPPDPREEVEDRLDDLRDGVEEQRGPYASDVIDDIEAVRGTVETTEWAEEGEIEVHEAVGSFLGEINEILNAELAVAGEAPTKAAAALEAATARVDEAGLDPDEDAGVIAGLLEATDDLEAEIEAATAFGDLPVREQLNREGFFDVLGHYKDFPPEWSALKVHEEERDVEMILLAYDLLDSNFMEEHCLDALRRLGDERAVDPMMELAQRRDKDAIEVLGKIGSEEPIEMFFDYIETDSDPQLQQVTLKALGEIGSEEATEAVAQRLRADEPTVRSHAARSLGMIGDPRAVDPLAQTLADDEAPEVRGSAAWALVQIGTAGAFEVLAEYDDDRSYLVETEAAKAANA